MLLSGIGDGQKGFDLLITIHVVLTFVFTLLEVVDIGKIDVNAVERAANTVATRIPKVNITNLWVNFVILPIWSWRLIDVL